MKETENKSSSLLWVAITCPATTEAATKEILRQNGVILSECEVPESKIIMGEEETEEGTLFEGICSTGDISSVVDALRTSTIHQAQKGQRGSILTKNLSFLEEHTLGHNDLINDFEIKFSKS